MTKYIALKIFDSKDYDNVSALLDKQYAIVHEDYYVGIIKSSLEETQ